MSRAKNRPKRTPVGSRNILTTKPREGYKRRWVNDDEDRIQMYTEAGYEPVRTPTKVGDERAGEGSNVGSSVVTRSVGNGQKAVLMEIPIDYYEEDQAAKEKLLKQSEEGLVPEALKGEGTYGDGIAINRPARTGNSPKVIIN